MEPKDGRREGPVDEGAPVPPEDGVPDAGEVVPAGVEVTKAVMDNVPTIADAIASHVADRRQNVSLDSWRAQVGLIRHQIANRHAKCWPSRVRLYFARRGTDALERMYLRIEKAEHAGRATGRLIKWYGFLFAAPLVIQAALLLFLPRCWCRKEDDDEG